jgi:hypothetical protein
MRKNVIIQEQGGVASEDRNWLDIEDQTRVELSSEDAAHPIESALKPDTAGMGWRASEPGVQTIRLHFDQPLAVRCVHLAFREQEQARTQEFLLRWSADNGRTYREIVRQQYSFSPGGGTFELEEYEADLAGMTELEITITPDISGGPALASLAELRLGGPDWAVASGSPPGPP